jgi:hypothetical protein
MPACRAGCAGAVPTSERRPHPGRPARLWRPACAPAATGQRRRLQATGHGACCYNRINARSTHPVPRRQASDLQLSIDDLGLPLSETVTAGARAAGSATPPWPGAWGSTCCNANCAVATSTCPRRPACRLAGPTVRRLLPGLARRKGLSTGEQDWTALEATGGSAWPRSEPGTAAWSVSAPAGGVAGTPMATG